MARSFLSKKGFPWTLFKTIQILISRCVKVQNRTNLVKKLPRTLIGQKAFRGGG